MEINIRKPRLKQPVGASIPAYVVEIRLKEIRLQYPIQSISEAVSRVQEFLALNPDLDQEVPPWLLDHSTIH